MTRGNSTRILLWLTWTALLLLVLQQGLDALARSAPAVIWIAKLLPLLLFVPGILRDNLRSFIWLCFISLGYFALLVERAFVYPGDVWVLLGLSAVVVLFVAAMLYVRGRARELRGAQVAAPG